MKNYSEMPANYYKFFRRDILPFVPVGVNRVLDVGCAEGDFGSLLKSERDVEVWGVEFNPKAAAVAANKLDKVSVGSIDDLKESLPLEYFDCIMFNDVLEHLIDPWTVLDKLTNCLVPGGHVVASIPNIRYYKVLDGLLFQNKFEYESAGVLDRTHLRFFTKNSIKSMFSECGLQIEILQGLNWEPMPLKYKLINRITNRFFEDIRYKQILCVAKKVG